MKPIIGALLLILTMNSCIGKKVVAASTRDYSKVFDSTSVSRTIERNGAIHDSWILTVPPVHTADRNCDSLCDLEVRKAMALLNIEKRSGENGWKMSYDQYSRQLAMIVDLKETVSELQNKDTTHASDHIKVQTKEIPVLWTPNWMRILAGIGAATILYLLFLFCRWIVRIIKKTNPTTSML